MKKLLLFFIATLGFIGSAMATVTTVVGTTKIYEVSSDRTTTLPSSGNSALYVLEQWNYANNSNYRYVQENNSNKIIYTTATGPSALTEANIVEISNTGTAFTIKFVKTNNYFQNIVADTQATTGASSSNLSIVDSPQTGGFNIYNADSNTDQLFFTLQNNNYPTGKTGRWAWGTFALYSVEESENFAASVIANIKPYFDCADQPFGLTSTALSTYESTYNTYKENCTEEQYNTLLTNIRGLYSDPSNYVQPTTGYYRIKSSGARNIGESYIGYGSSSYGIGLATVASANKLTDASTVIKLTGSAGTYKISTQGLNAQSQTAGNTAFPATDAEGVDFVFAVNANKAGFVTIRNEASNNGNFHGYLHEGGDGSPAKGVVNWQAGAAASQWAVEAATSVTVGMHSDGAGTPTYYATLCLPFDVTISNATAYTLAASGEWLVPTEVPSNQVPAGTPVLLKGDNATATATINTGAAFNSGSPLACALTGTYAAKTITGGTDYVLGIDDGGVVGFYHWDSNNLGANRAYVAGGAGVKGFAISWDELADGIGLTPMDDIESSKFKVQSSKIYNLAGQRLSKPMKGVNIVNGKKIFVK